MRKLWSGLTAAAVALLLAAPAHAAPSILHGGQTSPNFLGTTGLLLTPTAYTVGDRGIGVHGYFTSDFNSYGVTVGPFDRLELGVTLLDGDKGSFGGDSSKVIFNAKALLLKESLLIPGLAIGVTDAFDNLDTGTTWYAVASKEFKPIFPGLGWHFKAHFGYGGGIYDEDVFAGLELNLWTPLEALPISHPSVSAIAEYENQDVNLGLRARWKGFAATLGLFDLSHFGGGISYTTGLRLW